MREEGDAELSVGTMTAPVRPWGPELEWPPRAVPYQEWPPELSLTGRQQALMPLSGCSSRGAASAVGRDPRGG